MPALIDLTGDKYGALTVIKRGPNKGGRTAWYCKCDCGKDNLLYPGNDLRRGKTTSCGCLKLKRIKEIGLKNKIDLTGKKYGYLTVIEDSGQRAFSGDIIWKCQCECGNFITATKSSLDKGDVKSCGCFRKLVNQKDLIGQRFGKLVVIDKIYRPDEIPHILWKCQCDCGNIIVVKPKNLLSESTQSCGCLLSKGEQKVQQILELGKLHFEKQKSFDTCIFPDTNKLAKFDFYLTDLNILIEYDGIQHFKQTGWKNLEENQKRDQFKNQWCKENNIPLIRIPYTDFNKLNIIYLERKINECY